MSLRIYTFCFPLAKVGNVKLNMRNTFGTIGCMRRWNEFEFIVGITPITDATKIELREIEIKLICYCPTRIIDHAEWLIFSSKVYLSIMEKPKY